MFNGEKRGDSDQTLGLKVSEEVNERLFCLTFKNNSCKAARKQPEDPEGKNRSSAHSDLQLGKD